MNNKRPKKDMGAAGHYKVNDEENLLRKVKK